MTKIAWAERTWNVAPGCTKVSEGCKNCYAEKMAKRQVAMGYARHLKNPDSSEDAWCAYSEVIDPDTGKWNNEVSLRYSLLDQPLHWKTPYKIFVNSMGDLFHKSVPFKFISEVYYVTKKSSIRKLGHDFLFLTKRSDRMFEFFTEYPDGQKYASDMLYYKEFTAIEKRYQNVWLGTSAENQKWLDIRYPYLVMTPAKIRFLSIEPMLGSIDFQFILKKHLPDWVIVGAESINSHAGRYCPVENIQKLVKQCKKMRIPVFVKQIHLVINNKIRLIRDTEKKPTAIKDLNLPQEYPLVA